MSAHSEHALTSVVATVMLYDIGTKKWNDMGHSSVQIYQNSLDNTFRVVGSSRQTGQVTLDAPLVRNLKYSRATDFFIQWRDPDSRQVYGLSFTSPDAANGFQQWLDYATNPPPTAALFVPASSSSSTPEEPHYQRPQPRPAPSKLPGTSNGPDVVEPHQQSSSSSVKSHTPSAGPPRPPGPPPPPVIAPAPAAPAAAPPAPPPPPPPPPAGGGPPGGAPPPPPPPPPPPAPAPGVDDAGSSAGGGGGGLAAALASAKLKKVAKPDDDGAARTNASGASAAAAPSPAMPASGGDMMSEMAARLHARKKKAETNAQGNERDREATEGPSEPACVRPPVIATKTKAPGTDTIKKLTGSESPSIGRRIGGSVAANTSAEMTPSSVVGSLESFKQEMMTEMRQELQKIKDEIVQAILAELNKK